MPIAQTLQDIDFRVLFRRNGLSLADRGVGSGLLLAQLRQLKPQGVAILSDLAQSISVESSRWSGLLLRIGQTCDRGIRDVDRVTDSRGGLQALRE